MASVTAPGQPGKISMAAARELRPEPPPVIQSDLAAEIRAYLDALSVDQLLCLVYGHSWPVLVPLLPVPKGFRALPDRERQGVYRVTETCIREVRAPGKRRPLVFSCGTARTSLTLPARVFDRSHHRSYAYDNDTWEIRPAGSRLTRLDFLDEIYARMGPGLFGQLPS